MLPTPLKDMFQPSLSANTVDVREFEATWTSDDACGWTWCNHIVIWYLNLKTYIIYNVLHTHTNILQYIILLHIHYIKRLSRTKWLKHYDSYCSRTVSCVLECNCNSNWFKSFPPNNHGPTNRYLQHLLGLLISETLKTKRYCAPGNNAFSGNLSRVPFLRNPGC